MVGTTMNMLRASAHGITSYAAGVGCGACAGGSGCIDNSMMRALLDRARVTRAESTGQILFHQGAPALGVHALRSGLVALRRRNALGHTVLVRRVRPGETLGLSEALANGRHSSTGLVLTPSEVCFIATDALRTALVRQPEAWAAIARDQARTIDELEASLVERLRLPVRARLASLLLSLRDGFGTVDDDGVLLIDLPLSRSQIAEILAVRAETITRAIGALSKDGVALFERRRVSIPDLDTLMDEVEPPVELTLPARA